MRYSDLLKSQNRDYDVLRYNALIARGGALKPSWAEALRLLVPYTAVRVTEQMRAVVPLAVYLILFQPLILRQPIEAGLTLTAGLIAVVLGLTLFMEGLRVGLMPFGNLIGDLLPKRAPLSVMLAIIGLLGVGVTFAEPAIGALQAFGASVDVRRAPYLYELLNRWTLPLVLLVGAGVGLATIVGTLRFVYGWSLKPIIAFAVLPTLALTLLVWRDPDLRAVLGLAWDCGAVTTGPVTVPLVLAIGIGIATAVGRGESSLSGFGVVTLASLFPIMAVMGLALFVATQTTPDAIIAAAQANAVGAQDLSLLAQSPWAEMFLGARAILPLLIFLLVVLFYVLRAQLPNRLATGYGFTLAMIGMCLFNIGLTYGLGAIGTQTGAVLPATFMPIEASTVSPIYERWFGLIITMVFVFAMGVGATLAEPALNALGGTVQDLTHGAFRKSLLMCSVAFGVGCGLVVGVAKIIFALDLALIVVPLYGLALVLTCLSSEEFVNVAWDSAGVTTGPVTVPLVLALGLGLSGAVSAVEGFGILAMASICPILAVLSVGLYIRWEQKGGFAFWRSHALIRTNV